MAQVLFVFDPESLTFHTTQQQPFSSLHLNEIILMRDQNAAIKCQFLLAVNNFESNYILFKLPILFQRRKQFTLRNAELDIVDFNCNKEYSIRQLELNTSELNYYAIKV